MKAYSPKIIFYIERNNGVILTLEVKSLAELKFDPGFWVIGEYLSQIDLIMKVKFKNLLNLENLLLISSQFDSNIIQLLWIPGWIIVPRVTQLFRSK